MQSHATRLLRQRAPCVRSVVHQYRGFADAPGKRELALRLLRAAAVQACFQPFTKHVCVMMCALVAHERVTGDQDAPHGVHEVTQRYVDMQWHLDGARGSPSHDGVQQALCMCALWAQQQGSLALPATARALARVCDLDGAGAPETAADVLTALAGCWAVRDAHLACNDHVMACLCARAVLAMPVASFQRRLAPLITLDTTRRQSLLLDALVAQLLQTATREAELPGGTAVPKAVTLCGIAVQRMVHLHTTSPHASPSLAPSLVAGAAAAVVAPYLLPLVAVHAVNRVWSSSPSSPSSSSSSSSSSPSSSSSSPTSSSPLKPNLDTMAGRERVRQECGVDVVMRLVAQLQAPPPCNDVIVQAVIGRGWRPLRALQRVLLEPAARFGNVDLVRYLVTERGLDATEAAFAAVAAVAAGGPIGNSDAVLQWCLDPSGGAVDQQAFTLERALPYPEVVRCLLLGCLPRLDQEAVTDPGLLVQAANAACLRGLVDSMVVLVVDGGVPVGTVFLTAVKYRQWDAARACVTRCGARITTRIATMLVEESVTHNQWPMLELAFMAEADLSAQAVSAQLQANVGVVVDCLASKHTLAQLGALRALLDIVALGSDRVADVRARPSVIQLLVSWLRCGLDDEEEEDDDDDDDDDAVVVVRVRQGQEGEGEEEDGKDEEDEVVVDDDSEVKRRYRAIGAGLRTGSEAVLSLLCSGSKSVCDAVASGGGVSFVARSVILHGTTDPGALASSASLLRVLVNGSVERCAQARERGVVFALLASVGRFADGNEDTSYASAQAVLALSALVCTDAASLDVAVRGRMAAVLARVLHSGSAMIQEAVADTLFLLATLSQAHAIVAATDAPASLVRALDASHPHSLRIAAGKALGALAMDADCRRAMRLAGASEALQRCHEEEGAPPGLQEAVSPARKLLGAFTD